MFESKEEDEGMKMCNILYQMLSRTTSGDLDFAAEEDSCPDAKNSVHIRYEDYD
jgi:hypothetical protein